ncbi:MAG TPA: hypothetical protein VF652_06760 [Allosphingosinicella sp.]
MKAGQAVAEHLGAKAALGLHLRGPVVERDQAAAAEGRETVEATDPDLEMAAAHRAAVAALERAHPLAAAEEGGDGRPQRAFRKEGDGRDRGPGGELAGKASKPVVGDVDERADLPAFGDDEGGDRKRLEIVPPGPGEFRLLGSQRSGRARHPRAGGFR